MVRKRHSMTMTAVSSHESWVTRVTCQLTDGSRGSWVIKIWPTVSCDQFCKTTDTLGHFVFCWNKSL